MNLRQWAAVVFGLGAAASSASAQKQGGPAVGQPAPDFSLVAATRSGIQQKPLGPGDFRGKTVVLAFFYKARTKG